MGFFSIDNINAFSLPYDFLHNIFFSYKILQLLPPRVPCCPSFFARMQNTIHTRYKICINELFTSSLRLLINNRLWVVKLLEIQKLYINFQLHQGMVSFGRWPGGTIRKGKQDREVLWDSYQFVAESCWLSRVNLPTPFPLPGASSCGHREPAGKGLREPTAGRQQASEGRGGPWKGEEEIRAEYYSIYATTS